MAHGCLPLGQLAECLGEPRLGIAKLKAMMIVRLDLSNAPTNITDVTLVEGPREEVRLAQSV